MEAVSPKPSQKFHTEWSESAAIKAQSRTDYNHIIRYFGY